MPSADADASVQDEQWVALTRNLTLLPAQCPTEHEMTWSSNGENTMVCILNTTPRLPAFFLTDDNFYGVLYSTEPRRTTSAFSSIMLARSAFSM